MAAFGNDSAEDPGQSLEGWLYKRAPRASDTDKSGLQRMVGVSLKSSGAAAYARRWVTVHEGGAGEERCVKYYKKRPNSSLDTPSGSIPFNDIKLVETGNNTLDGESTPTEFVLRVTTGSGRVFLFCAETEASLLEWGRYLKGVAEPARRRTSELSVRTSIQANAKPTAIGSLRDDSHSTKLPWAADLPDNYSGHAPKSNKEEEIMRVATEWKENSKTFRPLRFLSGVQSGVISVSLYQITITNTKRNKETNALDKSIDTIHVISKVSPGPGLDAGLRPMDILLEVHGKEVTNQPVKRVAEYLAEMSEKHQGEFCLTIGRSLPEGSEDFPPGWGQYFDQHGRGYYYNSETSESSWNPPNADLPPGWNRHVDRQTGKLVYVNGASGETTDVAPRKPPSGLNSSGPVLHAGWLHKRRDDKAPWRVRWISVLRSGEVTWSKAQGGQVLGAASIADAEVALGMTSLPAGQLHTMKITLAQEDKKGHMSILLATEHQELADAFTHAFRAAATGNAGSDEVEPDLGDVYSGGASPQGFGAENSAIHRKSLAGADAMHPDARALVTNDDPADAVASFGAGKDNGNDDFDEDDALDTPYDAGVDMQGWVAKPAAASWKKYYGLLQGRNLRLFADEAAADWFMSSGQGAKYDLITRSAAKAKSSKGLLLDVETLDKKLKLKLDSPDALANWMAAINQTTTGSSQAGGAAQPRGASAEPADQLVVRDGQGRALGDL